LKKRGHEVVVLTTDALDKKSRVEEKKKVIGGILTYYLPNFSNWLAYKWQFFCPLSMLFNLPLKVSDYDLVHIHGYRHFLGLYVAYLCRKSNCPYMFTGHGTEFNEGKRIDKSFFDLLFSKYFFSAVKRCVAISENEINEFIRLGVARNKITVIPNGINIKKEKITKNLYWGRNYKEKKTIGFLGRISRDKGLGYLIESFGWLVKDRQDVILAIAGFDHGFLKEAEKLVKKLKLQNKVKFIGPLRGIKKTSFLSSVDVLVLPSRIRADIFGLVVFEAMLVGTPVIVSDRCGASRILLREKIGKVVKYGDQIELANKMRQVLEKRDKRVINRARNYVLRELNWNEIGRKILTLYDELIKG
jgi:glycosyltransferase involved in cell wall biosynthesis